MLGETILIEPTNPDLSRVLDGNGIEADRRQGLDPLQWVALALAAWIALAIAAIAVLLVLCHGGACA